MRRPATPMERRLSTELGIAPQSQLFHDLVNEDETTPAARAFARAIGQQNTRRLSSRIGCRLVQL